MVSLSYSYKIKAYIHIDVAFQFNNQLSWKKCYQYIIETVPAYINKSIIVVAEKVG